MNSITCILAANIHKSRYFFLILGFSSLLLSCGKPVEHSKFIPRETSLVVCFNLDSLDAKAPNWQGFFNREMPLLNIKRDYRFGKALRLSGIDFQSPIYFFSDASKNNQDGYYALCFKIKDESRFDRFLRELPNRKLAIGSFSGMRYTMLDNKTILGWVNKIALVVSKPTKTDENVLKDKLLRLRDLPDKQSLRKNNLQFQQLLSNPNFDIASWMNLDVFNEDVQKSLRKFLPPLNIDLDIKDNFLTSTARFNQGEVYMKLDLYNENQSLEDYKNIVKTKIDEGFIKDIPIEAPLGMFSLGLNMEGVSVILDNFWWNIFRQQAMSLPDSTMNEMLGMLTGDIVGVIQDIRGFEEENNEIYDYLVSMGIKEPKTLAKLLDQFTESGSLVQQDSLMYYAPGAGMYLIEKGKSLYITSSDSIKNQLLQSKNKRITPELAQLGDNSFFVLYADVQEKTRQKIPQDWFGDDRLLEGLVKFTPTPLESISLNTLPAQENVSQTEIVIKFKKKDKNSLQILLEALTEVVQEEESLPQIQSKDAD